MGHLNVAWAGDGQVVFEQNWPNEDKRGPYTTCNDDILPDLRQYFRETG